MRNMTERCLFLGSIAVALPILFGAPSRALAANDLNDVTHFQAASAGARTALLVDLDDDGDGDLVLGTRRRVLSVYLNDGGDFVALPQAMDSSETMGRGFSLAVGDPDGDGDTDIVACGSFREGRGFVRECRLFLNQLVEGGGLRFERAPEDVFPRSTGLRVPLFVDPDGDNRQDLILFDGTGGDRDTGLRTRDPLAGVPDSAATGRGVQAHGHLFLRNERDVDLVFTTAPERTIPGAGAATAAAIMDADARGTEIWVSRPAGPDQLLVWSRDEERYADRTPGQGPGWTHPGSRDVIAVDLDGDGVMDVVVIREGAVRYLHAESGRFVDETEAAGLAGLGPGFLHLATADFDRDGRNDFFAAGLAASRLMINQGIDPTTGATTFADRAETAGLAGAGRIASLAVQLTPEECDFSVHLLTASADARTGALVHVFPDDSAGHTIRMSRGAGEAEATFDGACVRGSDGPDRILGNERTSILYGGAGDDTLIARGGVTILDGGPGKDHFVATGYTIIRLPAADIEPGETIDCDPTRSVMIESPLSRTELERAGVVFQSCFYDTYCPDPSGPSAPAGTPRISGATPGEPETTVFECHGSTSRAAITAVSRDPFLELAKSVNRRNLVFYDGPGVGRCDPSKIGDCARYGLESCQATDVGYQCFPNLQQWCDDPFFARNVATETLGDLIATGNRFILPMVIWLPRSEAVYPTGSCNKGGTKTVSDWHESIEKSMSSFRSVFGQWGVDVDYRIRIFPVPAGSDFVDPKDPGCTDIVYSEYDPSYDPSRHNTIEDLVTAYPSRYSDGEINVYLTDQGRPHGESYSFPWQKANTSVYRKFILIHGGFGAIVHEMSHELGLGHPWDSNLARANGSDTAESRDSWPYRPFPDQPTGGLNLCVSNAECDGADAGPGICVTAPGAASGYCYNLKVNCATKGDRVCDTPWDTQPCFQVGDRLGEVCLSDDDCLVDGGFIGKSYETDCLFGRCGPRHCLSGSDCLSGLCVEGVCANLFPVDSQSCCDLHDDTVLSKNHNICVEWASDTKGAEVLSPGVGNSTTWPLARNAMTYHRPGGLVPGTYTKGQRDKVICRLHYSEEYGQILKKPRPDGEPCSTRPGATTFTYGGPNEDRFVPHGACASGVCSVNRTLIGPQAICASSSCSDSLTGSNEADADCGASCRIQFGQICDYNPPLKLYQGCHISSDCVSGVCEAGRCMPTCADGRRDGTEMGIDQGGTGSDPACDGRPLGYSCRFPDDCSQPAFCAGAGQCVTSADCPINIPYGTACTQNSECHGGVCRSATKALCATQACSVGYECRSGFCNTLLGKCECSDQSDCLPSDSCNITSGVCTNECLDGRCLGQCTPIRTGS